MIGIGLMLRGARGGGGAFSPISLNPELWLRSDLGITIGTGVSQWADQSGNGNHATQATSGAQPAYSASDAQMGGFPSVSMDGTDDFLAGSIAFSSTTMAVYAYMRLVTAAANMGHWSLLGNGDTTDNTIRGAMVYHAGGGITTFNAANKSVNTPPANGTNFVYSTRFDGVNNVQRINSTDGTTVASANTINPVSYKLGCRTVSGAAANFAAIRLVEFLIFPANLTSQQDADLRQYFLDRYGQAS